MKPQYYDLSGELFLLCIFLQYLLYECGNLMQKEKFLWKYYILHYNSVYLFIVLIVNKLLLSVYHTYSFKVNKLK